MGIDEQACPSTRDGYPLVFVDWVDSCEPENNSDVTAYELPEPQRIFQAGFLVHEEQDHVVVAGALKPQEETFDYVISIPRVAIVAIRYMSTESQGSGDE